ncbi:MAG: DUF58 domain-containing protein, partial [Polyangiaceae bacterium]|nr:DUF58 domain-containing protein [Polyangiaceae bacterium]
MQVFPTKPTTHLAIAGGIILLAGFIARQPAIIAWGAAILLAVAIARATALASISRIRRAGFEMLWSTTEPEHNVRTAPRGTEIELQAEVRNRDSRAARYVHLRPIASSQLNVTIEPQFGEVPANGRLLVSVKVQTPRVGRHAIHGLSLEVQGSPGLFEIPLTFANPYGIQVIPRSLGTMLLSARGGRSRSSAEVGVPGPQRGDGYDFREIRELQPGDSFKRIAWSASARRGKLLVRDFEHPERDIVWLVLDASVELWAGNLGMAPLDFGIDEIAAIAQKHLSRGDSVGLLVVGKRVLGKVEPGRGASQMNAIATALAEYTSACDADRSALEERDVAMRVFDHLRPLDTRVAEIATIDITRLAHRAELAIKSAPFRATTPIGSTTTEQTLRKYMAAFGMECPPRGDPERPSAEKTIISFFESIQDEKPKPSLVHVWGPMPRTVGQELSQAVQKLKRRGVSIRWTAPHPERSVSKPSTEM